MKNYQWQGKAELLESGMQVVLTGLRSGVDPAGAEKDVSFGVPYTIEGIGQEDEMPDPYFIDNVGEQHYGLGWHGSYEWELVK